jgi:hypothetical protein
VCVCVDEQDRERQDINTQQKNARMYTWGGDDEGGCKWGVGFCE